MLAPRQQVLNALSGTDEADRVTVTAQSATTPASDVERRLRNLGMCLIAPGPPLTKFESRGVKEERILLHTDAGDIVEQRRVHTPAGDLNSVVRHTADMSESRTVKRLFQKPEDYAALEALFASQHFADNGDELAALEERLGADVLVRPHLGATPMHAIMHELMGLEVFAEEWNQRRERVLELYKVLVEHRRRMLEVVARSPAAAITCGGHLNARETGEERFNRYFLPAYHEFADAMHGSGKLAGLHISGDPRPLAKALGRTRADYIEGFRPSREFDIADARNAWPQTALWIEMPPDVHQRPLEDRSRWIGEILTKGRGQRVLLEVAVGLPPTAYRRSLLAATAAVEESMKGKPLMQAGGTESAEAAE